MDNRERLETFFNELRDYVIQDKGYGLSGYQIYNMLSIYNLPPEERSIDLQEVKESVADRVRNYIESGCNQHINLYNTPPEIESFDFMDQGKAFKHIHVKFKDNPDTGIRDYVKVYLPINNNMLGEVSLKIYKFLNAEGINYNSKISGYGRLDNFIVRVCSVEDAKKLIKFCNENEDVKKHIRSSNPFVPEKNGIGVARDTYGFSYNSIAADELANFINKCRNENSLEKIKLGYFFYYLVDLNEALTKNKFHQNTPYHFCVKELKESMESIIRGVSPLIHMEKKQTVIFEPNYFYSFKRYIDSDNNYSYQSPDGRIIAKGDDEWYKLQSMKFCHALYVHKHNKQPDHPFALNKKVLGEIEKNFDNIHDGGDKYATCSVIPPKLFEQEPKIKELYATLYEYVGIKSRGVTKERAEKVSSVARRNTISRNVTSIVPVDVKEHNDNIPEPTKYQIGNKSFNSSIPVIRTNNSYVGIEFLNEQTLANIVLIKGDKLIRYKGVHISVDKGLLVENKENSEHSRVYRESVGNILSDEERNQRMLNTRAGHFGILSYSNPNKCLNKFYDPEVVKSLYYQKSKGAYNPQVVQEKYK